MQNELNSQCYFMFKSEAVRCVKMKVTIANKHYNRKRISNEMVLISGRDFVPKFDNCNTPLRTIYIPIPLAGNW